MDALPKPNVATNPGQSASSRGALASAAKGSLHLPSPASCLCFLLALGYVAAFIYDLSDKWFDRRWVTDDSFQQTYPFHQVFQPELFQGDLITELMLGYLAPVHYWLMYALTWLSGDPIMAGHWVHLLQFLLAGGFTFLAVRKVAGYAPAWFAVAWLVHTRSIMQRMTGGLPRGWAAPVIAAYLYFVLARRWRSVLILLLVGCLLHPPATGLCALAYGVYLGVGWLNPTTRAQYKRPLLELLIISPLCLALTLGVLHRPEQIGPMVSYSEASQMPEFQQPYGRFPYLPFYSAWSDFKLYGFQSFIGRLYDPGRFWRRWMPLMVAVLLAGCMLIGFRRRRWACPPALWAFLAASLLMYFAARALAFKLYVPNRHLQFPLAFFFIVACSVAVWRALHPQKGALQIPPSDVARVRNWRASLAPVIGLLLLGSLVVIGSWHGLQGPANFNFYADKRGQVFEWLRKNTESTAIVAGEPTFIDPLPLFAARKAFVFSEAMHPFYPTYLAEMNRRVRIVFKAHYARDFEELLALLEPEGINYFVFERKRFYPESLKSATYFAPHADFVRSLTSRPWQEYAFRQLPKKVDPTNFPALVFRDHFAAVIDLRKLREYVAQSEHRKIAPQDSIP
jgi:hypothetical protein